MFLELSAEEIEAYCETLRADLMIRARRLSQAQAVGRTPEDAVLQTCEDVFRFLMYQAPLKPFPKNNHEIVTLNDVTRYARRRMRAHYAAWKQQAARGRRRSENRTEEISEAVFAAGPPVEHPYLDAKFLHDLMTRLRKDELAFRVAMLIYHSHVVPGTKDLNICDNTKIAAALVRKPEEVRLARNRIHTVKNHLIAERNPDDEGPKS